MTADILLLKIESIRKEKGLTQKELALKIGMTLPNYSRLLKRPFSINFKQIEDICDVLKVDIRSLFVESSKWYDETSAIAITYMIHHFLADILKGFDHNLNQDILYIKTTEDKETLIDILLSRVKHTIVSSIASLDSSTDNVGQFLKDFFKNNSVGIYFRSKKDKEVFVDLYTASGHRGFPLHHPEL